MGDNRSYAALDWVIGEIGETLKQARQSLEAYVENTDDTTRIRFCLTHIHQVHGSLQMVEFYGAALLAEEMEHLAQALMNKSVRRLPRGSYRLPKVRSYRCIFIIGIRLSVVSPYSPSSAYRLTQ